MLTLAISLHHLLVPVPCLGQCSQCVSRVSCGVGNMQMDVQGDCLDPSRVRRHAGCVFLLVSNRSFHAAAHAWETTERAGKRETTFLLPN